MNVNTLKTIHYAIFDSHLNYANVVWVQNLNAVKKSVRVDLQSSKRYKRNTQNTKINGDRHRSKRIWSNFGEEISLIEEKFMSFKRVKNVEMKVL